jgi:3D (Asp-Asp-Asp) domain-containing protein
MAVPAVLLRGAAASRALAPQPSHPPAGAPSPGPDRGGPRWWPWLVAFPVVVLVALVVLVLVLLAGSAQQRCGGPDGLPGAFRGPGSLGGVAGTGLSRAQVRAVRSGSPYAGAAFTEGAYDTTAYGPPWGGINGPGAATSGGLVIGGGAPRWYMIAVDPLVVGHGQLVYAWPNPFGWRGPFLAADTGGAIQGRRIDFYDWRGRPTQSGWGHRTVRVSRTPIRAGGPDIITAAEAGACTPPLSSRVGARIGQLARAQLGSGPSIPGFEPPAVSYAWCAWFATNVWREAGVPIPINAWSGYPYDWAKAKGLLFKAIGRPPRGVTPPVGSALMYGISSAPGQSDHINLVDRVLPDGTFMVTGGNQDSSRVTRYGPCRLRRADPAGLTGPGCDARPIYGIAIPTQPGPGT